MSGPDAAPAGDYFTRHAQSLRMSHGHGTAEEAGRSDGHGAVVAALAGGLVTFVTVYLPFAPVVGGAVAGYLRAGDARIGAGVGGFAGVVTVLLLAGLAGGLLAVLPVPLDPVALPDPLGLALGVGSLLFGGYVLLCSVVGGVCGSYAASEIDIMGR